MAETLKNNALTSLTRVKGRLNIDSQSHDDVLRRMINAASDMIQQYLDRNLLRQTYTQEVYSIYEGGNKLYLRQYPVTAVSSLEYRAGTPSTPAWTAYLTDDYFLEEGGRNGVIYIYGATPKGPNSLRVTYTAGYLIDFTNIGTASHTLPEDISEVCDQIVTKWYRRRESEGKDTESFNNSSVTWSKGMSTEQKGILDHYRRIIFA